MSENVYEGLFIFDSNRYSRDPSGVSAQITTMVQKYGGTILASRLWEERRLAYPINGQRKGTYWLSYFRLDPAHVDALRRDCQINENILRELTLKVDLRIADALVTHALTSTADAAKAKRAAATPAIAAIVEEIPEGELDNG